MVHIRVKEFLLHGNLGPVRLGASIDEAHELLGEPVESGSAKCRVSSYCDRTLQISHYNGVIALIGIYFQTSPCRPPSLPAPLLNRIPFSGCTALAEFLSYLRIHQIAWVRDDGFQVSPGDTLLRISGCVEAVFESGFLRSILSCG